MHYNMPTIRTIKLSLSEIPTEEIWNSLANTGSNIKPNVVYLDGTCKNNVDIWNCKVRGHIALVYSVKSVNIVEEGKWEITVSSEKMRNNTKAQNSNKIDKQ